MWISVLRNMTVQIIDGHKRPKFEIFDMTQNFSGQK
jgi:hypothetical protein